VLTVDFLIYICLSFSQILFADAIMLEFNNILHNKISNESFKIIKTFG